MSGNSRMNKSTQSQSTQQRFRQRAQSNESDKNQKSPRDEKDRRFQPNRLVKILTDSKYEPMLWRGPFRYSNMVRLRTIADGSCFFHAIALAYFKPYILQKYPNGSYFDRKEFIMKLRHDLAKTLSSRVNPSDPSSPIYYDVISRGKLRNFSKAVTRYSLENMTKELNSNRPVDNAYQELVSDLLNKDIYILDMIKQDVYVTGSDDDILIKGRNSIVLLYIDDKSETGHFELVGLNEDGILKTVFSPNHRFIRAIQNRLENIRR